MEGWLEGHATEETLEADEADGEALRALPVARPSAELSPVRQEVRAAALAAAGGIAAGAATMILARATRSAGRSGVLRVGRRRRPAKVVASRSFVVDVHMLGER